jgi:hypothetical protein
MIIYVCVNIYGKTSKGNMKGALVRWRTRIREKLLLGILVKLSQGEYILDYLCRRNFNLQILYGLETVV